MLRCRGLTAMLPLKPRLDIRRHHNSQDRVQIGCDCNGFGACSPLNQVFDRDVNKQRLPSQREDTPRKPWG
jgi:hypothetical protein